MFRPGKKDGGTKPEKQYTPGTYTSELKLNNANLEVEVSVDESHINSIRFSNLDETVTAMYPLIQPAIEEIADQVYHSQSLENIDISDKTPYTSRMIYEAVREAVEKAAVP